MEVGLRHNAAARSQRTLHLVDVENLEGCAEFSELDAAATAAAYMAAVQVRVGDVIIIASSHHSAAAAWYGWPHNARRLVRSGVDGADRALLEVLAKEHVQDRFARVVIGSGDHIFAVPARALVAQGVAVTVVTRGRSLARELAVAVSDIRYLDGDPTFVPDISRRAA